MKFISRAHGSCATCQERRNPCIYRFFGPCKFDETGACQEVSEAETISTTAREKEITERQLDQSQLVLADDQILAADVEQHEKHIEHLLDKYL